MQDNSLDQPETIPTTRRRRPRRWLLWGGLGVAVAVGLLAALAVQLFGGQSWLMGAAARLTAKPIALPIPTAMPTPQPLAAVAPTTPVTGKPLTRQTRAIPANLFAAVYSFDPSYGGTRTAHDTLAFAPTDSRTGYLCAHLTSSATLTIWATHDGAATWTHVSNLPFVPQPDTQGQAPARQPCAIAIDAADPLRLNISSGAHNGYLSDDGGVTWRSLPFGLQLADLSTRGKISVALEVNQDGSLPPNLVVSDDDWRTFRSVDAQFFTQRMTILHVWQRPGDGALLVQTQAHNPTGISQQGASIYTLWESTDQGIYWAQFPLPPNLLSAAPALVAQPYGNTPWQVCGVGAKDVTTIAFLGCTLDGGQTWTARPLPIVKYMAGNGRYYDDDVLLAYLVSAITRGDIRLLHDGAIVWPFMVKAGFDFTVSDLFILEPGARIWRDLGPSSNTVQLGGSHPTPVIFSEEPTPTWVFSASLYRGIVFFTLT